MDKMNRMDRRYQSKVFMSLKSNPAHKIVNLILNSASYFSRRYFFEITIKFLHGKATYRTNSEHITK